MASGSSGRANNPGSKGFDFASDDILCSYEDYANQDSSNGSHHSDSVMGANSNKDFHKTRMSRASVFPAANVYSPPEESLNQEVISTVERTMKKYADNLMRFLEGISSRLSQLELYCYNLDKSIGEMRSDLVRDHNETDSKLKSLDKHLQEVRRSVQILRDKQELAETQKELAKLQLAQDSSSSGHSQREERTPAPTSDSKKADDVSDLPNTQLALALPHQVAPLPSHPVRPVEPPQQLPQPPTVPPPTQPPPQSIPQLPPYYLAQSQPPQTPYLQSEPQYRAAPQLPPQPAPNQVNQAPHAQQFPQYQQQWPQQVTQPIQPPPQNQIRAPQSSVYPGYVPSQPANPNPTPPETLTSSMPMQVPFSGIPQPGVSRTEPPVPYGYGGAARPPPPMKGGGFPSQPGDGYAAGGPHQSISSGGPYMMYESEAGRPHHPPQPQFSQAGYPPSNVSLPNNNPQPPSSGGLMVRGPSPQSYVRSHPYNELIDKLVSMGYRGDHVASVIQRLEEMGQPVDFNAVLDRLNGHPSGGSQRGW